MGRDHRGAALRRGRSATRGMLVGALLVVALLGPGSSPSYAADPTPTPAPTPVSSPVSTPSVSPPSEQQIEDAREALDRLRNQGKRAPATPTTLAEVAGPTAPAKGASVTSRISDEGWWTIGAGLLVLLVLSEATRVSVRRAKHRRRA